MDRYYNVPDEASKQWKKFGMDTEAGRMLNKLYAGKNKVQINYPRINTVSRKENMAQPRFIPAGGKKDVNPRSNRIMKVNVNRPKVGRGKKPKKIHAIDVIRRRKSKASIDEVNKLKNTIFIKSNKTLQKLPTSKLTNCIKKLSIDKPHPLVHGKAVNFKYAVNVSNSPLIIKIFTNFPKSIKSNYKTYLVNQIIKSFKIVDTKVKLIFTSTNNPFS